MSSIQFFSNQNKPPVIKIPTRDELLGVNLTFQGLVVETSQFGKLPGFEPCLPWLNRNDRQAWYAAKRATGRDTHIVLGMPDGNVLYNEFDNPYNPNNFGVLDWTNNGKSLDSRFPDFLLESIEAGFNRILLFLGGDGAGNEGIAANQIELLSQNVEYATNLYKYCVCIPGWDSVFYGWEPSNILIPEFAAHYRRYWPDGYVGLEHGTGHIPIGEGGNDYLPGGNLRDYDLILSEYDQNLSQDSCWQINGRLTPNYRRPSDQPVNDDPHPPYYMRVPNPRGPWYHCAFEYGEYEFVRCGNNFDAAVKIVNDNRKYLNDMGCLYTG